MKPKYYMPEFEVLLDHRNKQDRDLRSVITSVSLTTGLEGADRVELSIANQARVWLDKSELAIGTPFVLNLGYKPGPLVQMFAGEITGVAATFPSSGVPQLTVTAQDKRHRMKQGRQAGWHEESVPQLSNKPKSDEQLSLQVAGTHNLTVRREPISSKIAAIVTAAAQIGLASDFDSQQKAIRRQMNESDYNLLRRMARESGLEMVIDHSARDGGNTLKFFFPLITLQPRWNWSMGFR